MIKQYGELSYALNKTRITIQYNQNIFIKIQKQKK